MHLFEELNHNNIEEIKFIQTKSTKDWNYTKYLEKLSLNDLKDILNQFNLNAKTTNKKTTIDFIINNLSSTVKTYMDNNQLEFVKTLLKENGIIKYHPQYLGYLKFFYGLCFPIINNNEKYIYMPKEVGEQFSKIDKEQISLNSKITEYTRGLINLYGIIELDYLFQRINDYIITKLEHTHILSVISNNSISNQYIKINNNYIYIIFIENYLDDYEKVRDTIPNYFPFTDEEITRASCIDLVIDGLTTKQHVINIANIFNITNIEAENLLKKLLFALKEDIHFQLLVSTFKDINIDKIDQKLEYILNINDNIPKWSLKGHKYHQLNLISPLTIKKIVELILLDK